MSSLTVYEEWERDILEAAREAHYPLAMADTMARGTGGSLYHAHNYDARESGGKALCGMKPGKRGYWSGYFGKAVTCPRCLKIINQEQ